MTDNESAGMERLDTASFVVRGWMFSPTGLALSGNELLVYARIYGAVQRDNGLWVMPGRRLAVELGISANTACRCLNEFVRRGLIRECVDPTDGMRRFALNQDAADVAMRSEVVPAADPFSDDVLGSIDSNEFSSNTSSDRVCHFDTPLPERLMKSGSQNEFSSNTSSDRVCHFDTPVLERDTNTPLCQNDTPLSTCGSANSTESQAPTSTCGSSDKTPVGDFDRIASKDSALNAFKSESVKERNALGNSGAEEGSMTGARARRRPSEIRRDKGVRCESSRTEVVGSPMPSPEFDELVGHLLKRESPSCLLKCRALFDGLLREGWSARQIIDAYAAYAAWEQTSDQGKDDPKRRHVLWLSTWLSSDFGFRRFVKGAPVRIPKASTGSSELVPMFSRCSSTGDGWVVWLVDARGVKSSYAFVRCPASATEDEARRAWATQSLAVRA